MADSIPSVHHAGPIPNRPAEEEEEAAPSLVAEDTADELKVKFFQPALHWTDALPVGNGRLGAMVWGGVPSELLQLNEDTLWSGGPKNWNNPKVADFLPQVQNLVCEGRFAEATNLSKNMLGPDQGQVYQPLGDIKLDFGESHNAYDVDSYRRELDLNMAAVHVTYKVKEVEFHRQMFSSYPHQVLAILLTASELRSIDVTVTLDSQLQHSVVILNSQRMAILGQCPKDITTNSSIPERTHQTETNSKSGMSFAAILEVRLGSGKGSVKFVDNQILKIEGADSVVLLLAASSSFDGPFKDPAVTGKDPVSSSLAAIQSISRLSYSEVLASHLMDYQALFHRVSLVLSKDELSPMSLQMALSSKNCKLISRNRDCSGGSQDNSKRVKISTMRSCSQRCDSRMGWDDSNTFLANAQVEYLSTKERVKLFAENEDPALVVLLFQFGRYLLLASSRPGSFVSNLQGIWNKDLFPAWGCVPHLNINLQMNYWPVETCNLSECHQPLFELISWMAVNGRTTAKVNYKKGGWVGHHIVDIWGLTAPCSGDPVYGLWPMGGAWLCTHLWEHYQFTLDKDFLRKTAFPLMKGCAEFLLDWMVIDNQGKFFTNPATSPEHQFVAPDGQLASVSFATAMDMAIIREVFSAIICMAKILGDIDNEFIQKIQDATADLYPPKIGSDGLIMEWGMEFKDPDPQHRHMSHLFGLFPGHSISLQTTPELCTAAFNSIIKRGETGPGWSTAWKIALWARLWNGEHAYQMIKRMFTLVEDGDTNGTSFEGGLYGNLFCAHPPFQIDGNFGFTAAIAEILLQSDEQNIYLLPALPAETWPYGVVKGLRVRGGLTLSIIWGQGELQEVSVNVMQRQASHKTLHYKGKNFLLKDLSVGSVYNFDKDLKPYT